ncbi:MAG TPA: cadmium resistance transporter [Acidimicrobiales bacterium]|nr:cadmium resistance transporter [Acidimicrobiales bacterium]
MAATGFWADVGIAAAAFVGTNIDNTVVTATLVAGAPLERARRIAAGQVVGFIAIVCIAGAAAALLFEFSPAAVGLLGFVPLAIGVRGLIGLVVRQDPAGEHTGPRSRWRRRPATDRAVGRTLTSAALVTLAAGGDNLAVYIPLFRQGGAGKLAAVALVFVAGEVGVTAAILGAGRHPRARGVMTRLGAVAVPLLLCGVGVLVLLTAGTLSWL